MTNPPFLRGRLTTPALRAGVPRDNQAGRGCHFSISLTASPWRLRPPDGGLETLTILLRHDQVDVDGAAAVAYLDANVSSIATVEKLTDLKFFPRRQGRRVEATRLWSVAGFKFRSLVNPTCRTTAGARIQAGGPSVFALPNP